MNYHERGYAGLGRAGFNLSELGWVWVLAIVVAIVLAWTPSAGAATKSINGFIGGSGTVTPGGMFGQPQDVAIYTANTPSAADDKIFVTESAGSGNQRIQRLDSNGNFDLLWGQDAIAPGAPGNTGSGYEVCTALVSGKDKCKRAPRGSRAGEFSDPTGIAVNQDTGHVYVVESDNLRVQEFDLNGVFIRAWGMDIAPNGASGDTPSDQFEICTDVCQAGAFGVGSGEFADGGVNTIVVGSIAPHDVYVTDSGNRRVMQFEADGDFIRAWGWGVDTGTAAGSDQFEVCTAASGCQEGNLTGDAARFADNSPQYIAIDADGVVYVSDTTDGNRIIRFDADPAPSPPVATSSLRAPLLSPSLLSGGETIGLEINQSTGRLLATRDPASGATVIDEVVDPGGVTPSVVDSHSYPDIGTIGSLGYSAANDTIYLPVSSLFAPPTGPFTGCVPPAPSFACQGLIALAVTSNPLATSLSAPASVEAESAALAGTVDPGGGIARYRFQVSADGANWMDAADPVHLTGSGASEVTAVASRLEPATLYRVRLFVSKQTGISSVEEVVSNENVFLTDAAAPDVSTLGPSSRTSSSVRLRGLVDPQGSATSYRFEYGPAGGSFDHHIPIPDAQAGAGNSSQVLTQELTGLQPETAYQYRVVASNFVGTSVGAPVAFTTKAQVPLPEPPPGRAYELVSSGDKLSGVGAGIWFHGPAAAGVAGHAAYDGDRFAVQGTNGAVLTDGKYALANDWALSERGSQGWVMKPLLSRTAHGAHPIVFIQMHSATPSLSMMTWGGTTVKLFAEMENWVKEVAGATLYLRDWDEGKWEVFGPTQETQSGGQGLTKSSAVSGDSKVAVASGPMRGLAGPADPTLGLSLGTNSVYIDEIPTGPSDTFPGDGTRSPANVCTPGTVIPARIDAGGGSFTQVPQPCATGALISNGGGALGEVPRSTISADGSRVFFMAPDPGPGVDQCSGVGPATSCPAQVYVRQRDSTGDVVTRWISKTEVTPASGAAADQDASLMGQAIFEGASADGDKVLFRTPSPLTADDPNGAGQAPTAGGIVTGVASQSSWDLYMYDMPDSSDADPAGGELTRISAGPTGDGDCNSPSGGAESGALRFMSDDGSRLYFTCATPLDGVPVAGSGTSTSPGSSAGAVNLYAYDAARPQPQQWRFVAQMSTTSAVDRCSTDGTRPGMPLGPNNDADPNVNIFMNPVNCVQGIDDGAMITFWTSGKLTADDPDGDSGDIYAYDAVEDELIRVSAPQGGVGGVYPCAPGSSSAQCYGDGGIGPSNGNVPLPALGVARDPGSGEQMVFFESKSRLVPTDHDDNYDVYQWRGSELKLISSDAPGTGDAYFKGNDRTGTNVYIASRDRLSWQDKDSVLDIYSARVGNGIPELPDTQEPCDSVLDQCQASGQSVQPGQTDSDAPSAGNPPSAGRIALTLAAPSAKARRRAARTGRLRVRVATTLPALVRLSARARVAGRTRRVATAARQANGSVTIVLHLSKSARKRLDGRRGLRVVLAATAQGSRPAKATFTLKR